MGKLCHNKPCFCLTRHFVPFITGVHIFPTCASLKSGANISKAGDLHILGFRDEGRMILPLLERTRGKLISFTGWMTLGFCVEVVALTLIWATESGILSFLSMCGEGASALLVSNSIVSLTSGWKCCVLKGLWTAVFCAATEVEDCWDGLSKKSEGKRGTVFFFAWEWSACRRAALDWRRLEKKGVHFIVFSFNFSPL